MQAFHMAKNGGKYWCDFPHAPSNKQQNYADVIIDRSDVTHSVSLPAWHTLLIRQKQQRRILVEINQSGERMNQNLNSLLQLLTLFVGIAIGVMIAPRFDHRVNAQTTTAPAISSPSDETRVITLQSFSSGPAIAGNVILAGDLQADHATVNGYDILKIDEGIINYLGSLPISNNRTALLSIITDSKAKVRYALPSQKQMPNTRPTPPNQTPQAPK
jgi:hypothetical protein